MQTTIPTSGVSATVAATDSPIRAGIFESVERAERAVEQLLQAGFTKAEITVMCATDTKEAHFHDYEHQKPAGEYAGNASVAGGLIGATLGALTVLSGVVATGGMGLLVTGAIVAGMGGMSGTFVGAMMTRGVEKELANFYDQALLGGSILVAVEVHGENAASRLATAASILSSPGSKAVSLPEG